MMEEDQVQRHICKFCNKSFPCGRSLGGHIRSHMSNTSSKTKGKLNRKKVSSSVNDGSNSNNSYMGDFEAGGHVGYGLRENPKKTWRLSDSIDSTLRQGKVCKECGKGFQSWKALMDHMRYHSERDRVSDSLDDNSSFSLVNTSPSVSEIEQEKEEVAMCLMMLSRDVGIWGGFDSVSESSDNNSVVVEDSNGAHMVKIKKPRNKKLGSVVWENKKVRFERKISELEVLRNGFKKIKSEDAVDEAGFEVSDAELGKHSYKKKRFKCLETELGKDLIKEADLKCGKYNLSKRKISNALDSEIGKDSRKKGTNVSTDPTAKGKNIKPCSNKNMNKRKKSKHECPICFKVFESGQALGGHKRSHTVGGSESRGSQAIVIQREIDEIHHLLDLNLPAPIDEDTNGHNGFKPWWVEKKPQA